MKTCKHCGQTMSDKLLKARRISKGNNVRAGLLKRQEKGLPIGRPKVRDDAKILRLRKQGLSIRAIAKVCGLSPAPVQASLKAAEAG